MSKENERNYPFTIEDVKTEIKKAERWDNSRFDVDYGECRHGCGSNSTHAYYYVMFGWVQFQDGGKFRSMAAFIEDVSKRFDEMSAKLEKANIFFKKGTKFVCDGYDYWHCPITKELSCVRDCLLLKPSTYFIEVQKWLKKKANFDLGLTDLYTCSICQKRSSKSYSNYYYYSVAHDGIWGKFFNDLKANYKQGNVVKVEITEQENMDFYDRNRYEYEQYGNKSVKLKVTITTASGRNPRTFIFGEN
ncbi:MAG: hypothetical protein MJ237_06105 [bacterium]|nr:hypothetical protein [bacterium]